MSRLQDSAVSPVVGMVLLIAVTIALAFSIFYAFEMGPINTQTISVSREGTDVSDNGRIDHIGLTLRNANKDVLQPENYRVILTYNNTDETLRPSEDWNIGETKWFPCLGQGGHNFNIVVREKVAASFSLTCNESYENSQQSSDERDEDVTGNYPSVIVYEDCDKSLPEVEDKVSEIVDFCINDIIERI